MYPDVKRVRPRQSSPRCCRATVYFLAIVGGLITLAGGSPASAGVLQGTLVYGKDSIVLVNTGQDDLNLNLLVFVRDHPTAPARFEAREWGVPLLKPGQCVQVRTSNLNVPVPQGCRRLVRWLLRKQKVIAFWQPVARVKQFRVVVGSSDVVTCDDNASRCVFDVNPGVRVENLILTYTADNLWITNGALTTTPLTHMQLCRASNGPLCIYPFNWRPPDFDQILDPGECVELSLAKPAARQPCSVATSFAPSSAFWRQPFYVISPITAYATLCPPAGRTGTRRCVVPR